MGNHYRTVIENLRLLKSKKSRFKNVKDAYEKSIKGQLKFIDVSQEVQDQVNHRIREEMELERKRKLKITVISFFIGLLVLIYLVYLFKDYV